LNGEERRYLLKRKDGMRWILEVPHESRKDVIIGCVWGRMGCGKRRREWMLRGGMFGGDYAPPGGFVDGCVLPRSRVRYDHRFLSLHHSAMHFCQAIYASTI